MVSCFSAWICGRTVPTPVIAPDPDMPAPLTAAQQQLLEAIRQAVIESNGYPVWASKIRPKVGSYVSKAEVDRRAFELFQLGWVEMWPGQGNGTAYAKWKARVESVGLHECSLEAAREHLVAVVTAFAKDQPSWARYYDVANRFLWCDAAWNDHFRPHLDLLALEGACEVRSDQYGGTLVRMKAAANTSAPPTPPVAESKDPPLEDFLLLNALETREKDEINFGAYETAHTVSQIAGLAGVAFERALGLPAVRLHVMQHFGLALGLVHLEAESLLQRADFERAVGALAQ